MMIRDITERKQAEEMIQAYAKRLADFLESTHDCFFALDHDWRILFMNQRFGDAVGRDPQTTIGMNFWEVFPRYVGTEVEQHYRKAMQERLPVTFQASGLHVPRLWDVSLYPTQDGISVFSVDRTEEVRALEQLRESERVRLEASDRIRAVWEIATDAMAIAGPDGTVFEANPAYFDLYGYTPEQILGQNFAVIFPQELRAWANTQFQLAFANPERPPAREAQVQRASGELRTVEARVEFITQNGQRQAMLSILRDITARKQWEQEREHLLAENRRQKELLERIIQAAPIGIAALHGPEHRFVLANPAQHRLFPTIPQFVGHTVAEIWPEQVAFFTPVLDRVFQTGESYAAIEAAWQTDHGQGLEEAFYTFSYSPIYAADGQIEGVLALSIETTEQVKSRQRVETELAERKRVEAELRESEERDRKLVDLSPMAIFIETDGKVAFANQTALKMFGAASPEQLLGKPFLELTHPAYRELIVARMRSVSQAQAGLPPIEAKFLKLDGSIIETESISAPIEYRGRPGAIILSRDISESKTIREKQRAAQTKMEAQHLLLEQREQERQQIARDLHNGPVQALTGAIFTLQSLIHDPAAADITQALDEVRSGLQEQIHELRTYAGELRPPALAKFGLVRAIQSHLETFREKHPELRVQFDGQQAAAQMAAAKMAEDRLVALFRIYQEGLTNILKHAHASEVHIQLTQNQEQVSLVIRDNGAGFTVPTDWLDMATHGHLGLVGMRERAEAMRGALTVQSAPGTGTEIRVSVPLTSGKALGGE
jgi:PAS domain S-box-containing protein